MFFKKISLKNFRNYTELELEPHAKINVFVGHNAQGKTNLLESLYILSSSKSFRIKDESELIRWDCNFTEIDSWLQSDDCFDKRISIRWLQEGRSLERKIFKDDSPLKRVKDLLPEVPLTLFVPGDLALIQAGPIMRRRFLDVLLCKISREYCDNLYNYQKVLHQRNKFLHLYVRGTDREVSLENKHRDILDVLNEQLVDFGSRVILERLKILETLQNIIAEFYNYLSADEIELNLSYICKFPKNALNKEEAGEISYLKKVFAESLEKNYRQDLYNKSTQVGPHRDDFLIKAKDYDLRLFASQGQQRSLALAMRLAEAKIMSLQFGEEAIILLDDCLSELDENRSNLLLKYLLSLGQVFLTTTQFSMDNFYGNDNFVFFNVDSGRINRL